MPTLPRISRQGHKRKQEHISRRVKNVKSCVKQVGWELSELKPVDMVGKLHFGDVTITAVEEVRNSVTCCRVVQEREKIMDLEKILSNPKTKKLLERIMRVTVGDYFPGHKGRHTGEVGGSIPRVAGGGAINAHIETQLGITIAKVLRNCEPHEATEAEAKSWTDGTIIVVKGNGKYKGNQMYVWDESTKMFINNYDEQDKITKKELIGRTVSSFTPSIKDGMLNYGAVMGWKRKQLLKEHGWNDTSMENVPKKRMNSVMEMAPSVMLQRRKDIEKMSKKTVGKLSKSEQELLKETTVEELQKAATLFGETKTKKGQRNVTILQPKLGVGGKEKRLSREPETEEELEALAKATKENKEYEIDLMAYYDPSNFNVDWDNAMREHPEYKEVLNKKRNMENYLEKCKLEEDMRFRANMTAADFVAHFSTPNGLTSSMSVKEMENVINNKLKGMEVRSMGNISMHSKKNKAKKDEIIEVEYFTPKGSPIGMIDKESDTFLSKMGMKKRMLDSKRLKNGHLRVRVQVGW